MGPGIWEDSSGTPAATSAAFTTSGSWRSSHCDDHGLWEAPGLDSWPRQWGTRDSLEFPQGTSVSSEGIKKRGFPGVDVLDTLHVGSDLSQERGDK